VGKARRVWLILIDVMILFDVIVAGGRFIVLGLWKPSGLSYRSQDQC
jgi:hypothetical protein